MTTSPWLESPCLCDVCMSVAGWRNMEQLAAAGSQTEVKLSAAPQLCAKTCWDPQREALCFVSLLQLRDRPAARFHRSSNYMKLTTSILSPVRISSRELRAEIIQTERKFIQANHFSRDLF